MWRRFYFLVAVLVGLCATQTLAKYQEKVAIWGELELNVDREKELQRVAPSAIDIAIHTPDTLEISNSIQRLLDEMSVNGNVTIHTERIEHYPTFLNFYMLNNYYPAWLDEANVSEACDLIHNANRHGLIPEDYHYSQIIKLRHTKTLTSRQETQRLAYLDLLLTDGVYTYASHILRGKVNPQDVVEDYYCQNQLDFSKLETLLLNAIQQQRINELVFSTVKHNEHYTFLQQELVKAIELPQVQYQQELKLNTTHSHVYDIKTLFIDWDGKTNYKLSNNYDAAFEKRIIAFQEEQNLEQSGVIDSLTFQKVITYQQQRKNTIIANLERERWCPQESSNDQVLINIPEYKLYYNRQNKQLSTSKVVVGKIDSKTPMMKTVLTSIDVNPSWYVPDDIAKKEILPKLKQNPDYLWEKDMILFTDHAIIDYTTVDFSKYTDQNFPYRIKQNPGPMNALGNIKFIIENNAAIYMHDTPSRRSFNKKARAFSHGCIRLEYPIYLAELIAKDKNIPGFNITNALKLDYRTTRYKLPTPVSVHVVYRTFIKDNGSNRYLKDIYKWDVKTLSMLNSK